MMRGYTPLLSRFAWET